MNTKQQDSGEFDVEQEGPFIARFTADVATLPTLPGAGGNDFLGGLFGLGDGLVGDPADGEPECPIRLKQKLAATEKAVAYVCLLIGLAREDDSPEGDLIQAVMAQAIYDLYLVHVRLRPADRSAPIIEDMRGAHRYLRGPGLEMHCELLGVDVEYVRGLLTKLEKNFTGPPKTSRRR